MSRLVVPNGVPYYYQVNAVASDAGQVQYSVLSGPNDLTVSVLAGGIVHWASPREGIYDIEIRAELVSNPSISATQRWTLEVVDICDGKNTLLNVGQGVPGQSAGAAILNDLLYVLHEVGRPNPDGLRLSRWENEVWTTVADFPSPIGTIGRSTYQSKMISFEGALYMMISDGSGSAPDLPAILQWDGSDWSTLPAGDFTGIFDIIVHDEAIYALGARYQNHEYRSMLKRWDGTTWETINESADWWGHSLISFNDNLYVAGLRDAAPMDQAALLHVAGNEITPVDNLPRSQYLNRILTSTVRDGKLVLVGHFGRTVEWDGVNVTEFPAIGYIDTLNADVVSYKDRLYLVHGRSPFIHIFRLDDNTWIPISEASGVDDGLLFVDRTHFIEYADKLYVYGNLTSSCLTQIDNIALFCTEDVCGRISGWTYLDDNRNCTEESGETHLTGELLEISPGPFYARTDRTGAFSTQVPPGTYEVALQSKRNWMLPCPNPIEVTIANPAESITDLTFGTDMIPGIYDVRTSLMNGVPRPGRDFPHTLTYVNSGTEPATGQVTFVYDSRLDFRSSTTTPDRESVGELQWDFTNLPPGESVSINVILTVPITMTLGTELCAFADVELERKDQDAFLSDNRDSLCMDVRASYDPNDIQVSPIRFNDEFNDATLLPGDSVLSYLVRFQNTGNDTAFNVVVKDTLDPALVDIVSIQLGAASHDFDFDISGSGILTWTFNDIMLPDSNVNEPASHGYFKYTVHLRKGLDALTQIPNRASIYFDYNAPILTNTVVSVTSGTLSVGDDEGRTRSLAISPNPVQGTSLIRLDLSERDHVSLRLIDSRGDVVAILADKEMGVGDHTLSLDARGLPSGAYFITLERGGKKESYPVVISR